MSFSATMVFPLAIYDSSLAILYLTLAIHHLLLPQIKRLHLYDTASLYKPYILFYFTYLENTPMIPSVVSAKSLLDMITDSVFNPALNAISDWASTPSSI